MNHELVRALHEAGFPDHSGPTLEQLIDACSPGNFMLMRVSNNIWACDLKDAYGNVLAASLNYPTAWEAVARLWISLNAKR